MAHNVKISNDLKTRLNNNYIVEVPVSKSVKNDRRGLFDNLKLFLSVIIDRGSCFTLHDINFNISESSFWDRETFEDCCNCIFFTFKSAFVDKLRKRAEKLNIEDLRFYSHILTQYQQPYSDLNNNLKDPYIAFCRKKLTSLNKSKLLTEAEKLDNDNRAKIASFLNQLISDYENAVLETELKMPESANDSEKEIKRNQPFTKMLKNAKSISKIKEAFSTLGLPFNIFEKVEKVGNNRNPDGFKAAVAALIIFFREKNYFKDQLIFSEILEAFLQETENKIGKLSDFQRNYKKVSYYQDYLDELSELKIPVYT